MKDFYIVGESFLGLTNSTLSIDIGLNKIYVVRIKRSQRYVRLHHQGDYVRPKQVSSFESLIH